MAQDEACLMAVREDTAGRLVEKAATRFDLRNPLAIRPKTAWSRPTYGAATGCPSGSSSRTSPSRASWSAATVVDAIGLPDPSYFIFYDDVDFALRARRAGFRIWAVRDAVLVRQLDFDQQHDLSGWKGYYMYRNLFVVHLRYGENAAGPAQAVADHRRGGRCSARVRGRAGRGAQCDPGHARRAGNAGRTLRIRRLTDRVHLCSRLPISSSSAPASSA